jgi:hypothetical protein
MTAPGCDRSPRDEAARYVPSPELAAAALDASLRAWRDGQPAGPVRAQGRSVEVSDSERLSGRRLKAYAILGPIGLEGPRGFAVRLALDAPPEESTVRYLVVGLDPIWVFRQEDYERISHWEHKVTTPSPEGDGFLEQAIQRQPYAPQARSEPATHARE